MAGEDRQFVLAIKDNNTAMKEPCAICGQILDVELGPTLLMEDSNRAVCDDCGRQHAPELAGVMAGKSQGSIAKIMQDLEYWRGILYERPGTEDASRAIGAIIRRLDALTGIDFYNTKAVNTCKNMSIVGHVFIAGIDFYNTKAVNT